MNSSKFLIGDIFSGFISWHIPNSIEFYVVDDAARDSLSLARDFRRDVMWWVPGVGEMFLVKNNAPEDEEDAFLRCVRLPLDSTTEMRIQMIDIGEICTIKDLPTNIFVCPDELKKTPPLAIRCRGHEIFGEIDESLVPSSLIASLLYSKRTFEVIEIEKDLLVVDILPYDNQQWNEEEAVEDLKQIEVEEAAAVTGELDEDIEHSLTNKEKEIWDEEPLNTNNPQIALQGFQTRDDDRLCKFYDPKIGGCWKGGRCKLRHVAELKDGTLRDSAESHSSNIEKCLPLPRLHSKITFQVTEMITNNKFWCLYKGLKKTYEGSDIKKLNTFINMKDEVETYSKLKSIPCITQLVLYKAKDGSFHRARIESFADEEQRLQVLLVDEGITVEEHYKNLYSWNPRLDFLSFQAVEVEIANIKVDPEADKSEIFRHLKNTNGKPLKGLVVDIVPGIKCTLMDSEGNDIGEKLIGLGLAEERKPVPPITFGFGMPG